MSASSIPSPSSTQCFIVMSTLRHKIDITRSLFIDPFRSDANQAPTKIRLGPQPSTHRTSIVAPHIARHFDTLSSSTFAPLVVKSTSSPSPRPILSFSLNSWRSIGLLSIIVIIMIKSSALLLLSLSTVSAFAPAQHGSAFVGRHSVLDKKTSLGVFSKAKGVVHSEFAIMSDT